MRSEGKVRGIIHVSEFDSVEVEDAEGVGLDEAVQGEDLVHLDGRHEGAAPLLNDARN
jgi:hypothetical protein